MQTSLGGAFVALFWLGLFQAGAQQPTAKPPALPPINPAAARLDQTINGLDGAGFAIAYSEPAETLIAGCDRGTLQMWNKDVLLNIRAGSGSANVLHGHDGSVLALAWGGTGPLVSAGLDRKLLFWGVREAKS